MLPPQNRGQLTSTEIPMRNSVISVCIIIFLYKNYIVYNAYYRIKDCIMYNHYSLTFNMDHLILLLFKHVCTMIF